MPHNLKRLFAAAIAAAALTLPLSARDLSVEEQAAQTLKSLGLFRGVSDTDFDLDREPSRVEALVMLIRALGEESAATSGTWSHPFTDVPSWADPYVGYAYQSGLTSGISDTEYGTGSANAATYLTFVLRSLGYSDSSGDFSWSDPFTLAEEVGILPARVDTDDFWRADAALVTYAALSAPMKGTTFTLADSLMDSGVFTADQYQLLYSADTLAAAQTAAEPDSAGQTWTGSDSGGQTWTGSDSGGQTETIQTPAEETQSEDEVIVVSTGTSMTEERIAELTGKAVFWAPTGTKIHEDPKCRTFGKGIQYHYAGTYEQGISVRPDGWCLVCSGGGGTGERTSNSKATEEALAESYTYEDYLNGIPAEAFN